MVMLTQSPSNHVSDILYALQVLDDEHLGLDDEHASKLRKILQDQIEETDVSSSQDQSIRFFPRAETESKWCGSLPSGRRVLSQVASGVSSYLIIAKGCALEIPGERIATPRESECC